MTLPLDLEDIQRKAEAATPGPMALSFGSAQIKRRLPSDDAVEAFRAAANPETILALIAELKRRSHVKLTDEQGDCTSCHLPVYHRNLWQDGRGATVSFNDKGEKLFKLGLEAADKLPALQERYRGVRDSWGKSEAKVRTLTEENATLRAKCEAMREALELREYELWAAMGDAEYGIAAERVISPPKIKVERIETGDGGYIVRRARKELADQGGA